MCSEDDVMGSHGATIGNILKEQTYYLMCRGLNQDQIDNLFLRSNLEDALINSKNERMKAGVLRLANNYFDDFDCLATFEDFDKLLDFDCSGCAEGIKCSVCNTCDLHDACCTCDICKSCKLAIDNKQSCCGHNAGAGEGESHGHHAHGEGHGHGHGGHRRCCGHHGHGAHNNGHGAGMR